MYTAVLIDTISIQNYIFGSNKLKENIGGSFIIEHWIYHKLIPMGFNEMKIPVPDMDLWRTRPDLNQLEHTPEQDVELAYIGGGGALLLFRNEHHAGQFIKVYSQLVLSYFPGLNIVFGSDKSFSYSGDGFLKSMAEVKANLYSNRSLYSRRSTPYKHGVVTDCALSNEAEEFKLYTGVNQVFVSGKSKARFEAAIASKKYLENEYPLKIGNKKYVFPQDLENLGQVKDKGYIAVVHIDGNQMGHRFNQCKSLEEIRQLSSAISELANSVTETLLHRIVDDLAHKDISDLFELFEEDPSKLALPIRPLITGGDDITFVCEGRLGIYLAEILLHKLSSTPILGKPISACAGVAIVHTKYPFYKAYELANELMDVAKKESRKIKDSSWLSYMISTGGTSGSLEEIIKQNYTSVEGAPLKATAYRVDGKGNSFEALKNGIRFFNSNEESWPNNKLKALCNVLRSDRAEQAYFVEELKSRGLKLPGSNSDFDMLGESAEASYFDMVELKDFYPQKLLDNATV
ncbi:MAG: hypothetical protein R2792_11710 [Saprospiraceae bacterium]